MDRMAANFAKLPDFCVDSHYCRRVGAVLLSVAFQAKSNHEESGNESCPDRGNDGVCCFCRSSHNRHAGYRYGEVLWRVRWMVREAFKGSSSVPTEVRGKALLLTHRKRGASITADPH